MLRVLFDTNVFGRLILESDVDRLVNGIENERSFVVYGYRPIRREIQNIPKLSKMSRRMRIRILSLYDSLTGTHVLEHTARITSLARKYYRKYREYGGLYGWDTNIRIDFMIVACAAINGLDVVYSADEKTLLGNSARKAYQRINLMENMRTPDFLRYEELVDKFRVYTRMSKS